MSLFKVYVDGSLFYHPNLSKLAITEAQIQEALQRLIEGRTTFAIAHRLSTLKNANRLFVLDKGKIVEMGTHDELLRKKGIYFSLVMAQRTMAKRKGKTDTVSELLAN